ncbi:MAG TPA: sensor domain-containing diguanylate cyclase [Dehalococcoidia bacterium]|nr:sensor domain-containing diguanylate cyclase [Dehalococcoidia bacterium]
MNTRQGIFLAAALSAAVVLAERVVRKRIESDAEERERLSRATSQLKHSNDQLNALYNIFSEITETLSLHYVVEATLRETLGLMEAEGAVLWLIKDGIVTPAGSLTSAGKPVKGLEPQLLGEGLMGRTAKRGRTLRIGNDNYAILTDTQKAQGLRSGIMVPLIVGARVVGLLNCWSIKENAFSDEDQRILEMMASQVATAVIAADSMELKERQAHHDALTGLPNRHQLNQDLDGELKSMADSSRSAVVAMLDIDNFKAFNDDFGHKVGDSTLQKVAAVLRSSIRERDRVYRYGGEEFVLVFADANAEEAFDLADRLRRAVEASPAESDGARPMRPITVSIGLACLSDSRDISALIDLADRAMYQAKVAGRNRVVAWQDQSTEPRLAA